MPTIDRDYIERVDPTIFSRFRKATITKAYEAKGPLTVRTASAEIELGDDWEGWIAVDETGYPYPIDPDVFRASYIPATSRDVISREQPADAAAQAGYEKLAEELERVDQELDPSLPVTAQEVQKAPPSPGRGRLAR